MSMTLECDGARFTIRDDGTVTATGYGIDAGLIPLPPFPGTATAKRREAQGVVEELGRRDGCPVERWHWQDAQAPNGTPVVQVACPHCGLAAIVAVAGEAWDCIVLG